MCRSPKLLETIKIQNGQIQNIAWHNQRFNRSRCELFGINEIVLLENQIKISHDLDDEIHKCRIIYSNDIESIEFEKYKLRKIRSLKLVECNHIKYAYKYSDRRKLNELFQKKGKCDDILIIKNGLVTDTSFANIVFWDGENWITPISPLLKGTARERLLETNQITEAEISVDDLRKYKNARIINVMVDLENSFDIDQFEM